MEREGEGERKNFNKIARYFARNLCAKMKDSERERERGRKMEREGGR